MSVLAQNAPDEPPCSLDARTGQTVSCSGYLPENHEARERVSQTATPAAKHFVLRVISARTEGGKATTRLAGASAFAQGLAAVASLLLTRIYSPADFGIAAVFASLLSFTAVFASLRFELAVPLPEEDREARQVLMLCGMVVTVNAVVLAVILIVIGGWLAGLLGIHTNRYILLLLPPAMLVIGGYQALSYYAIRRGAYSRVARTKVTQGISGVLASIGVGLGWQGPLGLILGNAIGQGMGIASLSLELRTPKALGRGDIGLSALVKVARRYSRFPRYSVLSGLLNTAGLALTPLLVSALYSASDAGQYSLALRVVALPMSIVGQAVAQVFMGEASSAMRNREATLNSISKQSTKRLIPFGCGVLIVGGFAPLFFGFLFGAEWHMAGVYAAFLAVFATAQLLVSPISAIVFIVERQDIQLALDALRIAFVIASFVVVSQLGGSALLALVMFASSMVLIYGVSFVVYRRLALKHDAAMRKTSELSPAGDLPVKAEMAPTDFSACNQVQVPSEPSPKPDSTSDHSHHLPRCGDF